MNYRKAIRQSRLYRVLKQLSGYISNSIIYRLLNDSRILAVFVLVFIFASVVRILLLNMSASVKFLSFAVMFLILAGFVRNIVRPSHFKPPSVKDGAREDHE